MAACTHIPTTARRGMTLLEVALTISLVGMLAVFAWPQFYSSARVQQLDESVRRVKTLVAMCRAEAMNEARIYRVLIRSDGSIAVRRQSDPLTAPQTFVPVATDWARLDVQLEDVWVESVLELPDGPPPVVILDNKLQAPDESYYLPPDPTLVQQLQQPLVIDFQPDGTCDTLQWTMRDVRGRGVKLTLDGRIGRVTVRDVEGLAADALDRPTPLKEKELEDGDELAGRGKQR